MINHRGRGKVNIEPSDWRWGAAIVGLSKFFDYFQIPYLVEDEYIEFEEEVITKDKYLQFVEYYFAEKMHHKEIEKLLKLEDWTDEQVKLINEKLVGNSILKKVSGKIKFDRKNRDEILKLIAEHRSEIIENTYREGKALYANFCNRNNLFEEKGNTCRLIGYYVDKGRKLQSLSFGANKNTFVYQDSFYFDFIPFGFSKTREAFFINNNFTVKELIRSNSTQTWLKENVKFSYLLYNSKNTPLYIDYDVEVIIKKRELDHYETLFVRKSAVEIFKNIDSNFGDILNRPYNCKKSEKAMDNWIDVESIVTNSILNNIKLDNLIENMFKAFHNYHYLLSCLIEINQLIYKEDNNMKANHKNAYEAALKVRKALLSKRYKIQSFRHKLIHALSLKDYEKVKELLLHLSAYSQVRMDFLVDVFGDFEENKNLVYTFIHTLGGRGQMKLTGNEGEDF